MKIGLSLAAIGCTFIAWSASAQETVRYTVLMMEKPAGVQTSALRADGAREFTFEFNDRGRGPKLTSIMKLDEQGVPIAVETSGHDYLKAPVAETFTFAGGVARWKNNAENGEKKISSPAFYISMHAAPEELGLLANALLTARGKRLALLPAGEATIKQTGVLTLHKGETSRRVVSYEISGLGFTPETVWLDDDHRFFAAVSSWASFIREGWEASAPQLIQRQDEMDGARARELARALTRKLSAPLAITNANVFDADTGKSTPGSTVIIEGKRIKAVGRDGAITIPANAEHMDAKGRALLPGLWDMHVHVSPYEGVLHLAAGVTSIRDMANETDALQAMRRKFDAGEEIGPRILMTGFMDGRGPYAAPTKVFVDTEAEARTAIENYAKQNFAGIKIYSSIKPELVPQIINLAHAKGLRVSGHVPAFMTAQQFVEAGADELQHINFVFLNFFEDVKDTRTPQRFTAVAERAATLDLESQRVRSFVKLLKDRGTVIDPTVSVFMGQFTDRVGVISPGYAAVADRLPVQIRRDLLAGGLPVPAGKNQRYRDSAQALLRMVKLLYDAGITLVAGTDGTAGFTLHRELELYVQAGIPAPEVLRLATIGSARVMKLDAEVGSIAPGKLADLILVDGDPARRISDIRRTTLVIKDGSVFDPAALYQSVGVKSGPKKPGS
ncbi:MAG: amidohydrolase family protein [Steroidobacter sp.]